MSLDVGHMLDELVVLKNCHWLLEAVYIKELQPMSYCMLSVYFMNNQGQTETDMLQ